jgi:hypothetical protein
MKEEGRIGERKVRGRDKEERGKEEEEDKAEEREKDKKNPLQVQCCCHYTHHSI